MAPSVYFCKLQRVRSVAFFKRHSDVVFDHGVGGFVFIHWGIRSQTPARGHCFLAASGGRAGVKGEFIITYLLNGLGSNLSISASILPILIICIYESGVVNWISTG